MKSSNLLIFVLAVFLGCEYSGSMSEPDSNTMLKPNKQSVYIGNSTPEGKPFTYPILINDDGELKRKNQLTVKELKTLNDQRMKYMQAKQGIHKALQIENLTQAEKKIKEVLSSTKSHPLSHLIEQYAGNKILQWEFNDTLNSLSSKQVGFYTELLIQNMHPDATVIYPALNSLKDYWSDKKIVQAAKVTMNSSDSKLKKKKSRADLKKLGHSEEFYDNLNRKYTRITLT